MAVEALKLNDAREIGALLMQLGAFEADITEVFNPGEFCRLAPVFDLRPGVAMDIRTGWDFGEEQQRIRAEVEIEEMKPAFLVCSPTCPLFSQLQYLIANTPKYAELLKKCLIYLTFVMKLCKEQHEAGRWFVFEHPWTCGAGT